MADMTFMDILKFTQGEVYFPHQQLRYSDWYGLNLKQVFHGSGKMPTPPPLPIEPYAW